MMPHPIDRELRPAKLAEAPNGARRECGEPSRRMAALALKARIARDPRRPT
jgi:hypothetical protein